MKISKRQLRRIIKEEKSRLLSEMTNVDRTIGLYFDINQQKMAFDSLSVLFDESVEDAMLDGLEDVDAVSAVDEAMRKLFEDFLASRGR